MLYSVVRLRNGKLAVVIEKITYRPEEFRYTVIDENDEQFMIKEDSIRKTEKSAFDCAMEAMQAMKNNSDIWEV